MHRVPPLSYLHQDSLITFATYVAAAAALSAYDNSAQSIMGAFQFLRSNSIETDQFDYFAKAYICYQKSNDPEKRDDLFIVFAHRGTVPTSYSNIWDDILLFCGKAPSAWLNYAKPFIQDIFITLYHEFPNCNYTVMHTGHSLGAIHAEISTIYSTAGILPLDRTTILSYTFENPGSVTAINSLQAGGAFNGIPMLPSQRVIFNSDINAINTCQPQLSEVIGPCVYSYTFTVPPLELAPTSPLYYAAYFTLDQHQMSKIYSFIQNATAANLISFIGWPVGFQNGMNYYLNYDNHPLYWNAALKFWWDNSAFVRSSFDGDYSKFFSAMKDQLTPKRDLDSLNKVGLFAMSSEPRLFKDAVLPVPVQGVSVNVTSNFNLDLNQFTIPNDAIVKVPHVLPAAISKEETQKIENPRGTKQELPQCILL